MRESRLYDSVRGARDETRVPTATAVRSLIGTRTNRAGLMTVLVQRGLGFVLLTCGDPYPVSHPYPRATLIVATSPPLPKLVNCSPCHTASA
jgi:hypothetical protein